MNSEIKGNVIVYSIEENIDDIFSAFFYDDLISYVNSKYYNYIVDIAPGAAFKSAGFLIVLLALAAFCAKNNGVLAVSTANGDFIQMLKQTRLIDNFKIFDTVEKALAKFIKK
jgi:anti-anti-sigma regulatory factor